jgi:hypothetical protein
LNGIDQHPISGPVLFRRRGTIRESDLGGRKERLLAPVLVVVFVTIGYAVTMKIWSIILELGQSLGR